MARITVDDCLEHVDNRFDLVLLSTQRARQLEISAAAPFVEAGTDKPTVVALREIADGHITQDVINQVRRAISGRGSETEEETDKETGQVIDTELSIAHPAGLETISETKTTEDSTAEDSTAKESTAAEDSTAEESTATEDSTAESSATEAPATDTGSDTTGEQEPPADEQSEQGS